MKHEEIAKLTDTQLNELIALQYGFERSDDGKWMRKSQTSLEPYYCQPFAPQFTLLWQWTGKLLDKMTDASERVTLSYYYEDQPEDGWYIFSTYKSLSISCNKSTNRAISEAYAVMFC
jgi:hypothetical protein